ncbi:MAG: hypothetical protein ACREQM_22265, partial [Candidatus Dormibacteraceae bacterium]
ASYAGENRLAAAVDPLQPHYHVAIGTPSELRQAVRLGSDDPGVWVALGADQLRAGDVAAARRDLAGALAIYPYDAAALAARRTLPPHR